MIGVGMSAAVIAAWTLWLFRKGRTPTTAWLVRAAIVVPFLPLAANSFGWIFTEMGRQPWIVFGLMPSAAGVSPTVSLAEVLISLIGFTLLYGFLAVIEFKLQLKYIRAGLPEIPTAAEAGHDDEDERQLAFAY